MENIFSFFWELFFDIFEVFTGALEAIITAINFLSRNLVGAATTIIQWIVSAVGGIIELIENMMEWFGIQLAPPEETAQVINNLLNVRF